MRPAALTVAIARATPARITHRATSASVLATACTLAACVDMQDMADQIARQQARQYVNAEVQQRFPGVDATPITDCVIDNANAQEIVTIAGGIALGNTDAATDTVNSVLQRPGTLQCAAGTYFDGLPRGLI